MSSDLALCLPFYAYAMIVLVLTVNNTSAQNMQSSSVTSVEASPAIDTFKENLENATAINETLDACQESDALAEHRTREMSRCVSAVVTEIQVTSLAVVSQCHDGDFGRALNHFLQELGEAGVSLCVFASLAALTKGAMGEPDQAYCFAHREWTVALLGSTEWAAGTLATAKELGLYDARVHWLMISFEIESNIIRTLPMFNVYHRLTWIKWSSRNDRWVVLASEASERGIRARQAGRCLDHGKHFEVQTIRPLKPPYTRNFFQNKLRVISRRDTDSVEIFNSVGRCFHSADGKTVCIGYVGELLMILARSLNLDIVNSKVKSCGTANSNGTRVSFIAKDEADIALGTCSITYDRVQMVDFTQFFHVISSNIISAFPNVASSPFMIFKVLNAEAWLCVAAFLAMSVGALWVAMRILSRTEEGVQWSIAMSFGLISKALLLQAHAHQPPNASGRAVVAATWLVIITLVAVYSGNLTAWLSIPRYEHPINSLDDLLNRPDLTPVVRKNDPNHQMFFNKTQGTLGAINKRLAYVIDTNVHLTRRIIDGELVYMNSIRSHLQKATALNVHDGIQGFAPCRIHIGTQDIRQDYLGLMINKNSWFKEQMNRQLQWLRGYGVVNKLYSQYNPPGCRLDKPGRRRSGIKERLNLAQLQGTFWVWFSGMALGALALLGEMALAAITRP